MPAAMPAPTVAASSTLFSVSSAIDAAHIWHPYSTLGPGSIPAVVATGAKGAWLTVVRNGTEMQALTVIRGDEWLQHRGSVGRCVLGQIRIVGEDGQELPAGETGEIQVREAAGAPPSYFYLGAESKRVDGWDSLGDIGRFDADGYLYLADRRTDLILRGGANIYPAEVEAAIDEHPAVHSSAAIGLPDEDLGQRVHAIVHAHTPVTAEELSAYLASRLVNYKIPSSFEFLAEPLRGDDGKVRRSALREARMAITESTKVIGT